MVALPKSPLSVVEVLLCRHCHQRLEHRETPSFADPDFTGLWVSIAPDGESSSRCADNADVYDCPACWGTGALSPAVDCLSCDEAGRRADHEPVVSA